MEKTGFIHLKYKIDWRRFGAGTSISNGLNLYMSRFVRLLILFTIAMYLLNVGFSLLIGWVSFLFSWDLPVWDDAIMKELIWPLIIRNAWFMAFILTTAELTLVAILFRRAVRKNYRFTIKQVVISILLFYTVTAIIYYIETTFSNIPDIFFYLIYIGGWLILYFALASAWTENKEEEPF